MWSGSWWFCYGDLFYVGKLRAFWFLDLGFFVFFFASVFEGEIDSFGH